MHRLFAMPLLALAMLAGACAFGDEQLADLSANGVPENPNYREHIQPIMVRRCVMCHSEDGSVVNPPKPRLDDEDEVIDASCRIYVRSIQEESMPPGALDRLDNAERLTVERWVLNEVLGGAPPECPEKIDQEDEDEDEDD